MYDSDVASASELQSAAFSKMSRTPQTKASLTTFPARSMAFSSLRFPTKTLPDFPSAPLLTLTSSLWRACEKSKKSKG